MVTTDAIKALREETGISVMDCKKALEEAEGNKEKALEILRAKIYKLQLEQQKKEEEGMKISKTTEAEWGRQIRSYVFHPYKMVKDHRTDVETSDVEGVLDGELDVFIGNY